MLTPNLSPVSVAVHRAIGTPKQVQPGEMGLESWGTAAKVAVGGLAIAGAVGGIYLLAKSFSSHNGKKTEKLEKAVEQVKEIAKAPHVPKVVTIGELSKLANLTDDQRTKLNELAAKTGFGHVHDVISQIDIPAILKANAATGEGLIGLAHVKDLAERTKKAEQLAIEAVKDFSKMSVSTLSALSGMSKEFADALVEPLREARSLEYDPSKVGDEIRAILEQLKENEDSVVVEISDVEKLKVNIADFGKEASELVLSNINLTKLLDKEDGRLEEKLKGVKKEDILGDGDNAELKVHLENITLIGSAISKVARVVMNLMDVMTSSSIVLAKCIIKGLDPSKQGDNVMEELGIKHIETESYHNVSPELLANSIILGTMMDVTTIALRQGGILSTDNSMLDSDVVELLGNSIANQMKL